MSGLAKKNVALMKEKLGPEGFSKEMKRRSMSRFTKNKTTKT